jgi:hypothetical protein
MILNSTKFGGNQKKDVEVGQDRQTGRFLYTPPNYVCGGYNNQQMCVNTIMKGQNTIKLIRNQKEHTHTSATQVL